MALDVHLTRSSEEKWGFDIVGGIAEAPLRVHKVEMCSPAEYSGLMVGDTIISINGVDAIDMKHVDACRTVAECGEHLKLGVMRGLYDPVLDDQDPILEPYEPADSDQQLGPTEVFSIQQFGPQTQQCLESQPLDLLDPSCLLVPPPLSESRSLTSSPFLVSGKPYRPFSTEPVLEVPPIEDPIILNPEFRDQFGSGDVGMKPDELLGSYYNDAFDSVGKDTKFKLPMSAQYDPEGKNVKVELNIENTFKYIQFREDVCKETTVTDVKSTNRDVITNIVDAISVTGDVKTTEDRTQVKKSVLKDTKKQVDMVASKSKLSTKELYEEIDEKMAKEELEYIENMKKEIYMEKIEETATNVVDESIERAVSVAEEIKKEMDVELSYSKDEESEGKIVAESKKQTQNQTVNETYERRKEEEITYETKSENKREYENVYDENNETGENIETAPTQEYSTEEYNTKSSTRKESRSHEEIESNGERVSEATEQTRRKSTIKKENVQEHIMSTEEQILRESTKPRVEQQAEFEEREIKREFRKISTTAGDTKSEAEQRIYAIGLQTIPNIRGVVTSSYHYDLLLKTFFIHLTDVMVALSRFILTQPVFNAERVESETLRGRQVYETEANSGYVQTVKQERKEKVVEEKPTLVTERKETKIEKDMKTVKSEKIMKQVKPVVEQKVNKDITQNNKIKVVANKDIKQEINIKESQEVKQDKQKQEIKQEHMSKTAIAKDTEIKEVKKLSGSSMAQLSEKKLSQDLTKKMDAVVEEFQAKTTTDSVDMVELKKQMAERNRRSRSRSQVEEEVMRESDPLIWLDKVDSRRASQERTEVSKQFCSTKSTEKRSNHENRSRNLRSPSPMYIAIVESHVYTNKDAIFEEQVSELSETSSVQSAEEINTAFEAIEMESTENVAIENAVKQLETAKTIIEDTYLDKAISKSEATVEMTENIVHDTKEIIDQRKEEKAVVKSEEQQVVIQETREIFEPVIEIEESKCKSEKINIDITESLTTAQSQVININESKEEFTNTEEIKEETVSVTADDFKSSALKTELIADEFTEVIHAQEMEKIYEEVKPEYKIVDGGEVTQRVIIRPDKDKYKVDEASAELKIVKEVEIESQAEIIEIQDESELVTEEGVDAQSVINKLEILKSLEVDAENVTEKSLMIAEIDSNIGKKEIAVDKHESETKFASKVSKTDQVLTELKTRSQNNIVGSDDTKINEAISLESIVSDSKTTNIIKESSTAVAESQSETLQIHQSGSSETTSQSALNHHDQAKSVDKKLTLQTDLALNRQTSVMSDENNNINTPTPSTVPPTPLVDEYIFKLTIPLPKSRGSTPIPRDCTPEGEDPHIVKKKLIPHIETTIEKVVYDPPLPTPPGSKVTSPVYTKPGLRGGADRPEYRRNKKEEIREIERKSSLLASAIDETIKSIEEYKEEVGIDTKKDVKVQFKSSESYHKEITAHNGVTERKAEKNMKTEKSVEKTSASGSPVPDANKRIGIKVMRMKSVNESEQANVIVSKSDAKVEEETSGIVTEAETEIVSPKPEIEELISESESKQLDSIEVHTDEVVNEPSIENKLDSKIDSIEVNKVINETPSKNFENGDGYVSQELVTVELPKANSEGAIQVLDVTDKIEDKEPITAEIPTAVAEAITKVKPIVMSEESKMVDKKEKSDSLPGFRPVTFDPESLPKRVSPSVEIPYLDVRSEPSRDGRQSPYLTETGENIGTIQGIVDGLEETVIDPEIAKEIGKPGITEDKIAELISGEAELLREAHVMGLARVLSSRMHRTDDSSVDFQKIKPMINSLKDSEVLKALNEDLAKSKEIEKKKEEKKWTKFLQKPKRPVPKPRYGYHGWVQPQEDTVDEEPYKVKIVKQPKPKIAPDYKPEDFETGHLPWEERQLIEESLPPIEPEDPILIPEVAEFLEAVDPLPESEVPDLEDTGIPLPPPQEEELPLIPEITQELPVTAEDTEEKEEDITEVIEEEKAEEMDNRLAEQLVRGVQNMVDPNATLEQQLLQMRAQLAALAQLPEVIQQTLELVTKQLGQIGHQEVRMESSSTEVKTESNQQSEVTQTHDEISSQENKAVSSEEAEERYMNGNAETKEDQMTIEQDTEAQREMTEKQNTREKEIAEEQKRTEKQKKDQMQHVPSNQVPRRGTPKPKPQPKFGPLDADQRPVVLPGGRRWRKPEDVYNDQLIAETLNAQAELIQGKALGFSFESDLLPYDKRINFMKYEKPPVSLDHLERSEVYKAVHNMDQGPLKRVELLTPVIAEADYRQRCRSMTPTMGNVKHLNIPQQFQP